MNEHNDLKIKKEDDTPDCERIAERIVKILFECGVTYRETEEVLEYVCCKLWEQRVQDCD